MSDFGTATLDLDEKAALDAFSKSLFQNQPSFGTSSIIIRKQGSIHIKN